MASTISTMMKHLTVGLIFLTTTLVGACGSPTTPEAVSPTSIPSVPTPTTAAATPTDVPPATATAAPTPSATPAPTLDPTAVVEAIQQGQTAIESRVGEPLCLRLEDADDDGEPEWVGLHLRPTEPPRLEGFVLDGDAWYTLTPPPEDEQGMGRYPTCRLEVRDVNEDGSTELLIWGHTTGNVDLLHVFVWREATYALLASARGDAGVDVVEINGDLSQEIVARYDAGDGLVWEQVHTWDGSHYGWTWERYGWLYADHPHAYPTHSPARVVISYYLALNDRDLPAAHDLLSPMAQASQPYEGWAAGFDTMLAVEVGSVHEIERVEGRATVTALVRSYDNLEGYVVGRLWDVTWSAVLADGAWQLERSESELLDRWEAVYFP